jgi:hypothetical protein
MTRQNIKKAVYDFATTLKAIGGVGLIYYSGHGMQRNGRGYIFPYDSFVRFDRDLEEELIPVSFFYDAFHYAGNPLNLLVVDACRDYKLPSRIDSFGRSPADSAGDAQDENVVVFAGSALSGFESVDGTGNRSPYADAFSRALQKKDMSLSQFFSIIGVDLHGLTISTPAKDVANSNIIDGRDFVFFPSQGSFNLEKEIFNNGITAGNRQILESLKWQYSGGYFYRAAVKWLATAPLLPSPPVEVAVTSSPAVELVDESNIRSAPRLNADIVATPSAGTRLSLAGRTVHVNGSNWLPVSMPGIADTAFIRNDRARLLPPPPQQTHIEVGFDDGPNGERPDTASIGRLNNKLLSTPSAKNSVYSIVGYRFKVADGASNSGYKLLGRQAIVAKELKNLGFDVSHAAITTIDTAEAPLANQIEVNFNE